jgi:hypothetical protein
VDGHAAGDRRLLPAKSDDFALVLKTHWRSENVGGIALLRAGRRWDHTLHP